MTAALLAALLTGAASALDRNDHLALDLGDGQRIEGYYYSSADGVLVVSGDNRFERVPVALVADVALNGEPVPLERLRREVAEAQAALDAYRADPPSHPPPGVVFGMSLLWSGSGHAALGDTASLWGYSLVEATLLGVGAWNLATSDNHGVLLPLGGVLAVFRGYAAAESAREARRRRQLLGADAGAPPRG